MPHQNSKRQKGDMKKSACRRRTDTRRRGTKLVAMAIWRAGFVHPFLRSSSLVSFEVERSLLWSRELRASQVF